MLRVALPERRSSAIDVDMTALRRESPTGLRDESVQLEDSSRRESEAWERWRWWASGQGVRDQIVAMRSALADVLETGSRQAYWTGRWTTYVYLASCRVERSRRRFYAFRVVATLSAVIVPALVGLNLSGAGGTAVRWCTFSLSLVAAVCTAVLGLFRFGDRWNLYRDLQTELLAAGWTLVSAPSQSKYWPGFMQATENAIAKYNGAYDNDLIRHLNASAGASEAANQPE